MVASGCTLWFWLLLVWRHVVRLQVAEEWSVTCNFLEQRGLVAGRKPLTFCWIGWLSLLLDAPLKTVFDLHVSAAEGLCLTLLLAFSLVLTTGLLEVRDVFFRLSGEVFGCIISRNNTWLCNVTSVFILDVCGSKWTETCFYWRLYQRMISYKNWNIHIPAPSWMLLVFQAIWSLWREPRILIWSELLYICYLNCTATRHAIFVIWFPCRQFKIGTFHTSHLGSSPRPYSSMQWPYWWRLQTASTSDYSYDSSDLCKDNCCCSQAQNASRSRFFGIQWRPFDYDFSQWLRWDELPRRLRVFTALVRLRVGW